jgi:hypothetical protein
MLSLPQDLNMIGIKLKDVKKHLMILKLKLEPFSIYPMQKRLGGWDRNLKEERLFLLNQFLQLNVLVPLRKFCIF